MSIHRLLKRQFPVRSRVWAVAFLFCILLIFGCGGEETANNPVVETASGVTPDEAALISTKYFPMTVGNRWVYRNPDGSEWAREVTETEEIGSPLYHFFDYDSFIDDNQSDSSENPIYSPSPYVKTLDGRLTYEIKLSDLNDAVWQTIALSGRVSPDHWFLGFECRTVEHGAECRMKKTESIVRDGLWRKEKNDDALICLHFYDARVVWNSELTALRFPLVPYRRWKAIEMRLSGTRYIPPFWDWEGTGDIHSFEVSVTVSGSAGQPESVITPAGAFEDCIKIQYEMTRLSFETTEFSAAWLVFEQKQLELLEAELRKELTTLFRDGLPRMQLGGVWLAPNVGPVKIETPDGIAELIDYEIKTVASGK